MLFNQDLCLTTITRQGGGISGPIPSPTTNPTYILNDTFPTLTPLILFRHHALIIPFLHRIAYPLTKSTPGSELFTQNCTLR